MKKMNIRDITLSAMFIALGLILPLFTGQIPKIGSMMLPMHIPVLLCGLICGWKYGMTVGFITPILRSFTFGRPVLFPSAVAMAFELATYGFVIGYIFSKVKYRCIYTLIFSLSISMVCGRVIWAIVSFLFYNLQGNSFTWQIFVSGAFVSAIPGIILQFVLIPSVMILLSKAGFIQWTDKHKIMNQVFLHNDKKNRQSLE